MTLELLTSPPADVTTENKRILIQQDIQVWKNTRFQAESRRRVYARLANAEAEAAQIKILQDCEAALMDLDEQIADL